jgi:hypothetical protein
MKSAIAVLLVVLITSCAHHKHVAVRPHTPEMDNCTVIEQGGLFYTLECPSQTFAPVPDSDPDVVPEPDERTQRI